MPMLKNDICLYGNYRYQNSVKSRNNISEKAVQNESIDSFYLEEEK